MTSFVVHWDDVDPRRFDKENLRGEGFRLGTAAGAARAGVTRYRMGPGERCMPAHVHADEEEIFYVLAGTGLSWQDGRTYAVREGDCVVHRINAEAHTIIGGDEGLDVLAFGEGSDTGMTWLPRAQAWWMGPRWLPHDGPNPFVLEDAAGPLELPEPEPQRPPTIVALAEIEPTHEVHGRESVVRRDFGDAAGSRRSGLGHVTIPAGTRGYPHHCHSAEEELFVILDGNGTLRLGEELIAVRPGHVIARPPGTGVAHSFIAGDDEPLVMLAYGTRDPNDMGYFPDSNKFTLCGLHIRGRIELLDYWDGEE
jgi:uncharacterized cupin superfamily protein